MKMTELRKKAREIGIKPGKMKKTSLIHTIQRTEGNPECYTTAEDYCDQLRCSYREDCFRNKPE